MIRAGLAATLMLGACGVPKERPQPTIVPVQVNVPVTGACVPKGLTAPPVYPDSKEALQGAKDASERYFLMGAGWPLRNQRLTELEIVVAGCPKE